MIQKKKEKKTKQTCRINSCQLFPLSNGYCFKHQNEEVSVPVKEGFKNQTELFNYVWDTRPHVCFVLDDDLNKYNGTTFFLSLFAHVLRKAHGFFPEYKLKPENIVLLSPEVHSIFDNPTLESILKFEKENNCSLEPLFDLEKNILSEYNKEFKTKKILRKVVSLYYKNKEN